MISLNSNMASMVAAYNLGSTNVNLQKSLKRLSSGSRINSSSDDPGGMAVAMRLSAAIRRTEATNTNVNNALTFLETQDGILKAAGEVLVRMAELAQLSADPSKSTSDLSLYQAEYANLTDSLLAMTAETFNGAKLLDTTSATSLAVYTSQDASSSMSISIADLASIASAAGVVNLSSTPATTSVDTIDTAIHNLATLRAQNGAEQSRLGYTSDILDLNKNNLESAYSRIMDVDVAAESANMSRLDILQRAGIAMLAQANQSHETLLRLIT